MLNIGQNKTIGLLAIQKLECIESKKVNIKNRMCYYIDDIIKIKDFDFNNILLDHKLYENILIMTFHTKL